MTYIFTPFSYKEGYGITASPSTAKKGNKVTLTVADRVGFGFDGWTVVKPAGLTIAPDNPFTIPEGAVEITAKWKKGAYNITVNSGGAPDVAADKKSAKENETVTLTHGTYEGYNFIEWTAIQPQDLVITAGNDDTHTFTMPAENVEVTTTWREKPGVKITSKHILTAQGLELAFAATVAPQSAPQQVTWSVTGNDKASSAENVLKVAADAKPGTITVKVAVNGYEQESTDERSLTILPSKRADDFSRQPFRIEPAYACP
ncbi:MAG: Ig-like domain-containing protein [Treponema sp.]|nr:Ig-like domain-containing protein [Treponema sp.]